MQKRFLQPRNWQWGQMTNADGVVLRTGSVAPRAMTRAANDTPPVAHIIFAPGLGEFSEKYFELANILVRLGYHFHTFDWRGQGGSPRYLKDHFRRHSLGFDLDVRDLVQFSTHHVPDTAPKIYIGHSMAGLIGLMTIKDHPSLFKAGIISAPAFGVSDKRLNGLESLLASVSLPKNILERYVPGGHGWTIRDDIRNIFKAHDYTSDPIRMKLHDEWSAANPALRLGTPTIGFAQEISRAITAIRQKGVPESVRTPVLIFSAGQDKIVRNTEIFNMAARIPGAFHTHISAAKHEIFLETDDIRGPVMRNIHNFIKTNTP